MKILLLEDNAADTDLIKRSLIKKIETCTIKSVSTLKDARNLLDQEHDFQVALLDVNLPDGSGLELLLEIINNKWPIITIVLTGSGDEDLAVTALKYGADDFVIKKLEYLTKLNDAILFHTSFNAKIKFRNNTKIKVLYVEHHLADVDLTIRHFKKYAPHFKFDHIADVNDFLTLLNKDETAIKPYQLLLIDYRLPKIDGLILTKIIRQELKLNIPIIIITGQGNEEIAVQALKIGANDYMVKRDNYIYRLPSLLQNAYQHWLLKQQQEELKKSHQEYKLFFDDDLTGDFIATVDGYLENCNPAYLKILGYKSIEEARNHDFYLKYKTPEVRKEIIRLILEKERLVEYEYDLIRTDGKTIHVISNIVGVFDDQNKLLSIKGYIIDNTERKIAVDELRKLSRAVEQSPASIMITDLNGNIEYVNPKYSTISGYSFNEVKGKNPNILKSGNTKPEVYENLWNTILNGKEWSGEFLNKKKDGSTYWENIVISSIKDTEGNLTHFLAVKEDITQRKKFELDLIAAKEKAEESDRLKSAFLTNMSHEIRTPMSGILGFSELLKTPDLSPEKQQKYIEIIEKSGNRMLTTINDIMDISKIEAGLMKVSLSDFNINEKMEEIFSFFKLEADKKGLELMLTHKLAVKDEMIKSDREKVYSIITNLVKNAIKFTNTGKIEFGVQLNGDMLHFNVKDTGIGIPINRQAFVFDRFVQADIEDKDVHEGSGLGLSISKSYVEMLQGEISLNSTEGVGSEFKVSIPLEIKEKIDSREIREEKRNPHVINKNLNILIVEDDEISLLYLTEVVSDICTKIYVAKSGIEAIEIFKKIKDIDVVLMDIRLQEMDGLEATRKIREFNKNVTIIAQTAYAQSSDKVKAISAGCNDYISKPINQTELLNLIEKNFQ
ncbi:response regulator [Lutibacter sp.]|uniref:response regulator n=1 Tax=Lutibacter sp. TaxID=1925666 RepID=UPI002733AC84|nr:response regulator [Lutibacter sp.]MDP3312433.1 response regulator [Lutibacter sp.]